MHDKEWLQDRASMTGRKFDIETLKQGRGECLSHVRMYFNQMENELLVDGREYLLGTKEPTLAGIHAIWTFDWTLQEQMHMFEYLEKDVINADQFPKTFAYVERFRQAVATKQEENGKSKELSDEETIDRILSSECFEPEGMVDPRDPLKLKKGQMVEVWPIESGFSHHDKGELISLGMKEVVMSSKPNVGQGQLRLHFPRVNFRIQPVAESKL